MRILKVSFFLCVLGSLSSLFAPGGSASPRLFHEGSRPLSVHRPTPQRHGEAKYALKLTGSPGRKMLVALPDLKASRARDRELTKGMDLDDIDVGFEGGLHGRTLGMPAAFVAVATPAVVPASPSAHVATLAAVPAHPASVSPPMPALRGSGAVVAQVLTVGYDPSPAAVKEYKGLLKKMPRNQRTLDYWKKHDAALVKAQGTAAAASAEWQVDNAAYKASRDRPYVDIAGEVMSDSYRRQDHAWSALKRAEDEVKRLNTEKETKGKAVEAVAWRVDTGEKWKPLKERVSEGFTAAANRVRSAFGKKESTPRVPGVPGSASLEDRLAIKRGQSLFHQAALKREEAALAAAKTELSTRIRHSSDAYKADDDNWNSGGKSSGIDLEAHNRAVREAKKTFNRATNALTARANTIRAIRGEIARIESEPRP